MPLLEGVFAAAVTPRRLGLQDINLGVLWELMDFLTERGAQGIVLLGATGEFVHYSTSERMRMTGLAPRRSRVPVLINVSHSTLDGAVELAQAAASSGAAGVLLMPPYFFRYSDEALRSFYLRFAEDADIQIPTLLYNIPQFTSAVSPDLLEFLLRQGAVHGVKDSSGDPDLMTRLVTLRREIAFTLMIGNDNLFARALPEGISGVISGVACAVPELLLALSRAVQSQDGDAAGRLETRLAQIIGWIDRLPVPVAIKEAIASRGLKVGPHAVPLSSDQSQLAADFRSWLKSWLEEVLAECKSVR
ncbi:MAG TPA: dihydrodipicolinate synthase family protein [Bryobacteraceae bacterium]|nr:dihydrodipicolinate synthase family protein [Bryobacteraceae bacterium]